MQSGEADGHSQNCFFLMYKMKYIEFQGNLYVEMHFKNVLKIRLVLYVLLY